MPKKLAALVLFVMVAGLILTAVINSALSNRAEAAQTLPPVPTGLKSTFTLGLGNQAGNLNWMTASGIKWDNRYQYLAGGANTGTGWSTWNTPAGMFATYYMNDSANAGFMPVFTYYMLLQSTPANGSNEWDKDYNNLNNPSTMNAYYADFKLLMDRAKVFGKPVIIHVEPDFWAYMQHRSTDPNSVSASVASSNYADVAGLPNTVAGFAQALVKLRNQYAPNALLAYHMSPWASSTYGDLGTSHDANFNVQGAAQETANFYLKMGANFDLFFYDVADRDAALYQSWGNPNTWWDVTNATYPNFNRFHQFASALTSATGKRGMLWQVPLGNTIYRTLNNTTHHWQDNRVQYYLNDAGPQHLQDLMNAGIIGIMFGAGDGQSTSYDDGAGDNITNPAPINNNNAMSNYPDDDGGYLRLQAQAYYNRGALTLPSTSTTPSPTATATNTARATATATTAPAATPTATTAPATATATKSATATPTTSTGGGNGLSATYFANMTLSGTPVLSRIDPTVNFNWGTGSPGTGVPADSFSARWLGQVKALTSEVYTFCTRSDDGVRLWVNGQQLVNNWTNHAPADNCNTITLSKDQLYSLKMEYYENSGGAVATLSWQTPTIAKQIIPKAQLYTTTGSATPTPTPNTSAAATATPTATATPPASWQMSANVSGPLSAGSTLNITGNFTAPAGASGDFILDVEVYDLASGAKVGQWATTKTFTPGQQIQYPGSWQAPAAGRYQVRLGVFNSPNWSFVSWLQDGPIFQVN